MPRAPSLSSVLTLTLGVARAEINERDFPPSKIVTRDVAIIGGGASGTYAAVRLREDLNTSIVIIEPQKRLGGHVDTYTIPGTNTTIEFGVQSYMQYGPAPTFFQRFGVDTIPFAARRLTTVNVDITTGKPLTGYIPPSSNATTEAFKVWLQFLEKYESYIEPGFWNFPSLDSIPPELLLPFGKVAKKHNIAAAIPRIAPISGIGAGGFNDIPTLTMIQAFGPPITRAVLDNSLIAPAVSNSLLYQRAYALLQNDVYLESSIKQAERNVHGVRLVIATKHGGDVLVKARHVLWTPYPSHERNLKTFDEDKYEAEVFGGWVPTWAYVGVLHVSCIPENYSVAFIAPGAVPSNYLSIRDYPYTLRLDSTGPEGMGLFRVLFSANYSVTGEQAREIITRDIRNLVAVGTLNYTGDCKVEYRAFASHNGVLWPRGEELEGGFVQRLNALQGRRGTWWTGRSWCGFYTSNVWAFTETVLGRMVRELRG